MASLPFHQLQLKLFNITITPRDISDVSDEVLLRILFHSTPRDLLAFQLVSKRFYGILDQNQHCWRWARHNIDPPVPPPPRVEAVGFWTESAYAQLLFGGGNCCAKSCQKWTINLPLSFALRLRVCSPGCFKTLHRGYDNYKAAKRVSNHYFDSSAIPGKNGLRAMGKIHRDRFRDWLVYDERDTTDHPTYLKSMVNIADNEWLCARAIEEKRKSKIQVKVVRTCAQLKEQYRLRAAAFEGIMENARQLQVWAKELPIKRKELELVNVDFVKEVISPREQIPFRKLLRTATLRRELELCADASVRMDVRAWCAIRAVTVKEYKKL
ncbi:hypothetical protein FB45DRAFT_1018437 [Roridomyces roridus]|uniref:F-box domain-containing protein n=1 Tax=Roridomyces roridus TaxID=1738132 RepID=A0AAD7CN51_9AGAR|nr:hypothetical protein FB45DRAFT_1018437 [Roridomyces roridus]